MKQDTLREDQRRVAEEVGDDLERAFTAAHEKLTAAGLDVDDSSTACQLCGCDGFAGLTGTCTTSGCGHRIQKHIGLT